MTHHRSPDRPQATAPKPAPAPAACRTPEAIGRQLDAELEQSFPASDPPSMVRDTPSTMCGTSAEPPATATAKPREGKARRPHA
ncbi:hypothetical protein V5F53_00520 [Xanthobacter sp. V4C-4]|uniref:hypothetical protein n=1 Tax=Xanthobacter cornucopiae TaxID=3119924 RepID=UPI003729C886